MQRRSNAGVTCTTGCCIVRAVQAVDLIRAKRDGGALTRDEIEWFIQGVVSGAVPDYQASAFLMAVFFRGMSDSETAWLTDAMARSGERLDFSSIPGPKIDKHSTGGVGDKTSLVIAPLAAACGVKVPMISGRGLAHTGGTVDKLEAIPGYRTDLSAEELRAQLMAVGAAITGPSAALAPADRTLYALRDVTATVESLPLICASILSKKIAEGIDGLVLDVKTGAGAFMKGEADARRLAQALVHVGGQSGVPTWAVLSRMDAPLGRMVGNALEVREAIETLKGRGPADLEAVSVTLAARMVEMGKLASDAPEAERRVRAALESGDALDRFRQMVAHQGGDPRIVDDDDDDDHDDAAADARSHRALPRAPGREMIRAARSGYVASLDAEAIGRASMLLGGGRARAGDTVDHAVGIVLHAKPGDEVREGDAVLELHYRDRGTLGRASEVARQAIDIADAVPALVPLILDEIR